MKNRLILKPSLLYLTKLFDVATFCLPAIGTLETVMRIFPLFKSDTLKQLTHPSTNAFHESSTQGGVNHRRHMHTCNRYCRHDAEYTKNNRLIKRHRLWPTQPFWLVGLLTVT